MANDIIDYASAAPVWYLNSPSGEVYGPMDETAVNAAIASGGATPYTMVWQETWKHWMPIGTYFRLSQPRKRVIVPVRVALGVLSVVAIFFVCCGIPSIFVSRVFVRPLAAPNASSYMPPPSYTPPPSKPSAAQFPVEPFDVKDVVQYYDRNEVAGDEHFKDKWMDVRGRISTIGVDLLGSPYVTIGTGRAFGTQLQFLFPSSAKGELASLSPNEMITIRGKCRGKTLMNILMVQSEIVGN